MQESIIALCLAIAVGYLGSTFYKKIRLKNSGCCGCSGDCCSKKHSSCTKLNGADIQPFLPNAPTIQPKTPAKEA